MAKPLGFIPDVFRILEKYGLLDCIDNYLANGTLPSEHEWKTLVKERIARKQSDIWLKGVSEKPELINYGKVHTNLQHLNLWQVTKRNPLYIREILNTVNIICGNVPQALMTAVTDEGTHFKCKLCAKDLTDVSRHFLLDCPYSRRSREYMFDKIQGLLDVRHSASLLSQQDDELYLSLLSGYITSMREDGTHIRDNFVITVAIGLLKIIYDVLLSQTFC